MAEWIGEISCSDATGDKLIAKHGVTIDEVREAVCWGAADEARWHDHPEHGRRLVVKGSTYGGRLLIVVLAPVDRVDGRWECKTARVWRRP